MKSTDLSVIILNYNTKELLRKCLESIIDSQKWNVSGKLLDSSGFTVEIIVVDNFSKDTSVDMIKSDFPFVKLIENKSNIGYAGGNNLAAKHTGGKYVLFLNSDTEINKSAFEKSRKFMESDDKIGAFTPKTILYSGGMDPDCHRGFPTPWASFCYFTGLEKLFPQSRIFGQYHKFYLNMNENHEIDAGFGTYLFTRKSILDQIGWWDDGYFFYGEDLDLFYRIKQVGWKIFFYAEPLLIHHKGASSGLRKESKEIARPDREIRIRVAKASVKAMERFYQKFYKDKYPPIVTFLIIAGIKVKGAFRIIYHLVK